MSPRLWGFRPYNSWWDYRRTGSGVWAFLSVCPFGLGGFLLQRDLSLTTPFSPAWLHYDAYQDGEVWRQKMTIFDSRAIPYFNKSGVTYKFTGFLFPSAW